MSQRRVTLSFFEVLAATLDSNFVVDCAEISNESRLGFAISHVDKFDAERPCWSDRESSLQPVLWHHAVLPSEYMDPRIRVLVAKPGLDGHDRGAKVIARALRDAGMEVIYTGLRQTPEMIVSAALQEDVQVIGLSILSGAHNAIVPRIMDLLREKGMDDVLVLVGGIIPDEDAVELKKLGVAAVFQPGASLEAIVDFIRSSVKQTA